MRTIFTFIALTFLSACTLHPTTEVASVNSNYDEADYQVQSAGLIGCAPDDIAISNIVSLTFGSSEAWQASCKKQRFYCSRIVEDHRTNYTSQIACTKAMD